MSSQSPQFRPNGRDIAHGPALPAFESLRRKSDDRRPVRAESSASGSQRSGIEVRGDESENHDNGSPLSHHSGYGATDTQSNGHPARRSSKRSSGGFLLDSVSHSPRVSPSLLSRSFRESKGKRKSDESELSIPKRRLKDDSANTNPRITSSPLATEYKPDRVRYEEPDPGDVVQGTDIRHSLSQRKGGAAGRQPQIRREPAPVVGFETDPTQIVNMALSLSEGRRRQASAKRYMSGGQGGNRAVSSATASSGRDRPVSGSLAQYLIPQQQVSQPGSPIPRSATPVSKSAADRNEEVEDLIQKNDDDAMSDVAFMDDISRATQARVQKARNFFELAYEHRRLLSHLPPVRRPGTQIRPADPEGSSKTYNPLQYIRNRKLRIWDKTTIDTEADGWHDINKVRQWVDAVIMGNRETQHEPDECLRLPPLSQASSRVEEGGADKPKTTPVPRPADMQYTRPRRPRSDWVIHPGDMIADCFWLEQGMNKIKILDRDNNQVYPPDTQFKFSGWRNRTPLNVPANLQGPTPPPENTIESGDDQKAGHSPLPELPIFQSARTRSTKNERGRKRDKIRKSIANLDDDRSRRKGLRIIMDSDTETSDSSMNAATIDQLGRERASGRQRENEKVNGHGIFQDYDMSRSVPKDNLPNHTSGSDHSQPSSAPNSKRASMDQTRFGRLLKRDSKGPSLLNRSQTRDEITRTDSIRPFPNFENENPRNSMEYDSTAPNSPAETRWPSIAIKLDSPPHSRSPSPSKRSKPSILNSFKERFHEKHDKLDKVQTSDFADELHKTSSRNVSSDAEKHDDSSTSHSRGTSPMTRGISPTARDHSPLSKNRTNSTLDLTPTSADHRASTVSRISSRTSGSGLEHGRIRGMFKGGRIAEIVGNEVSRVGDFIWKRDVPAYAKNRGSISDASYKSYDSETDEDVRPNGNLNKPRRPTTRRSRSSTISSIKSEKDSPTITKTSPQSGEKSKYHNPNLPTFISPFQQDKERQEKTKGLLTPTNSPPNDHISRQAIDHRTASKSPRLDKLAPPKLDTSGPSTPDGLSRQTTYGFGSRLDLTRSKDASNKFNSAISGRNSPTSGALKGSKSAVELSRGFNLSTADLAQHSHTGIITRRDITRAEALIVSSAVKAREIARRADAPRHNHPPKYLLDIIHAGEGHEHTVELSQIRRREEHVIAARNIMQTLSKRADGFNEKMRVFTTTIAPSLHTDLQMLEDMVDNKTIPRARVTADEAGELSMKLTTTSTLAVKDINDLIENAIRERRRGPIRWVRRLWYTSIEWAVVFLLWAIWAIVTFIRSILGVLSLFTRTTRWMLWID